MATPNVTFSWRKLLSLRGFGGFYVSVYINRVPEAHLRTDRIFKRRQKIIEQLKSGKATRAHAK